MEQLPLGLMGELGKYGLLGIITGLLLFGVWNLLNRLHAQSDNRIDDWKELAALVRSIGVTISEIIESNNARTRASEAIAKAMEMLSASQAGLTLEVGNVRLANQELRASNGELRGEIQRLLAEVQRLREVILTSERSQ